MTKVAEINVPNINIHVRRINMYAFDIITVFVLTDCLLFTMLTSDLHYILILQEAAMLVIGQQIYFKRQGDKRMLKGTIIGGNETGWTVRGCRTATRITPPVHAIPPHEINEEYIPAKLRTPVYEKGHGGCGMSVLATESIRRQQLTVERLGMTETQILQARALLEMRRRTVRYLASQNRIVPHSEDFEFQELNSEYIVAQLTALRATASTATDTDIREFKRYLSGEVEGCKMMITIKRTSKTAAIRYLKQRAQYYRSHFDIADYANRLAA